MHRLPLPLLVVLLLVVPVLAGCLAADEDGAADPHLDPIAPYDGFLSPQIHDAFIREVVWTESSVDGIQLRADVYRPPGEGPHPVILLLSPYWSFLGDAKENELPTWQANYFVPRGYAVALGEMRGTRDSEGCWDFGGRLDQMDGHDMVETLAAQPWANGNVGMIGGSHVGMSQIAAAVMDPPSLKAIVPVVPVTDWYRYLHKDGAPYVVNRGTPPAYFAVHASPSLEITSPDWVLRNADTTCPANLVHLSKSAELHGDKDAYWQERDLIALAGNIRAATFLVPGFLDENVKTDHMLDFWQALPDDTPKRLWFGQYGHQEPPYEEYREDVHRWFDHFLMGIDNGITDTPSAVIEDSTGRTRYVPDWPGPVAWQEWMLQGHDHLVPAESGTARGTLTYTAVPGHDRSDGLPRLEEVWGPTRLGFTSPALEAPLHLAGEVRLSLEGTLDQPTARWIAVLYDVDGNGSRDEISRAYLDARHRQGLERGVDVPVGVALEYELNFFPRDHVVAEGHRLQLTFEGGDMGCTTFAGPCEGTGILPVERIVQQTVHTGPGSVTRLTLPVLLDAGPERELTPLENGFLSNVPP